MKKLTLQFSFILAFFFIVTSCQQELTEQTLQPNEKSDEVLDREKIALNVLALLQQKDLRSDLVQLLSQQPKSMALEDVLENITVPNQRTANQLEESIKASKSMYEGIENPRQIEVPELWMHMPQGAKLNDLVVSFATL